MNSHHQSQSRKTFFVSLNDEEAEEKLNEQRQGLTKQIFQLAYHGHISPEYASSLEINERNYIYQLLVEQLEGEKKAQEAESKKMKAKMPNVPKPRVPRR
jgi:hypothetical protein